MARSTELYALSSLGIAIRSVLGDLEGAVVDADRKIRWVLAIHGAANGPASPQDLFHRAAELLRLALRPHLPANVPELVLGEVPVVLDVLHLLAVAQRLLQLLDYQGGRVRHHVHLRRAVLDREPDSDADPLPGGGCLHDVIAHLLRGHPQGADLRRHLSIFRGGNKGERGLPRSQSDLTTFGSSQSG